MHASLRRVASFLFFSGACALVYQVAWFRELRLVFGGSTAASSAVLAVFMGGLGAGGIVLGKRADRAARPFAFYAHLELIVAATAAVSPLLVRLAQAIYVGVGGSGTLGSFGATLVRLLLTVIVLGPSTFAMGGTMPAAARAVEEASDARRNRVAVLYGVNTIGAVLGALAANFVLLEVFGTRMTLWMACLVNVLVALGARAAARTAPTVAKAPAAEPTAELALDLASTPPPTPRWFPPFAAAVAGFAFMLMELVWYRMLAPLLGGSSYTLGLILAVALAGIGIGGALYAFGSRRASLSLFALTCAVEALAIAFPFALGDRIAIFALLLGPLARATFTGSIIAWSLITVLVVLPAAIASGYQFPAIIALYGRGAEGVGRDVGRAYLANTAGAIAGAIGGGFGLLPLLTAPHCWQLVVAILIAATALSFAIERRRSAVPALVFAACAGLAIAGRGPTSVWRHSGIGAGRTGGIKSDQRSIAQFEAANVASILWEEDGLESSVAIDRARGYSFLVNGKGDGHVIIDRQTQVMSGLVGALIHDDPKTALIIGLGTGSTAGWLAAVPAMTRVDVMEMEPAILRVAKDCAPANEDVLANPKVHVKLGDAREGLLTSRASYDIVFSEPSNPYRAGISSLYTVEFYRAVAARLAAGGIFVQWLQTYEVDPYTVGTAIVTLRDVFPNVTIWETEPGDILLIARKEEHPPALDVDRIRKRLGEEPYATAAMVAWGTDTAEGVLAHFLAEAPLANAVVKDELGVVNRDDDNILEFAFARRVGTMQRLGDDLVKLSHRFRLDLPRATGAYDVRRIVEERLFAQAISLGPIDPLWVDPPPDIALLVDALRQFERFDYEGGLAAWDKLARQPRSYFETTVVATAMATAGDPRFEALKDHLRRPTEKDLLTGVWLAKKGDTENAIAALVRGFEGARKDPWVSSFVMIEAVGSALTIGTTGALPARTLSSALGEPFSVEAAHDLRVNAYLILASRTADPRRCVEAFDKVGPVLFERDVLESRVSCFTAANDPRKARAEDDLRRFYALSPSFGASIQRLPAPRYK